MSAAVVTRAERDAFTTRAHARAVRRVTRSVGQVMLVIGGIYWAVFLVVTVGVPLVVRQAGGVMGGGAMTGAEYATPWFSLSLGLIAVSALVVPHLAAGGTRRSLFTGALVAVLAAGVAYGVAHALLLLVERGLFSALGWQWEQLGSGLDSGGGWLLVTAAGEAITVVVYALAGIAAQAAYRTCGVWRGTALMLPGLALLVLVGYATRSGSVEDVLGGLGLSEAGAPAGLGLLQALVVLALAAGWAWWQLRTLRLRPTR